MRSEQSSNRVAAAGGVLGATVILSTLLNAPLPAGAIDILSASGIKYKLQTLVDKPGRCMFQSSSMGQANGARDQIYDLRMCKMSGLEAKGFDLSGLIGSSSDFSGTNFRDAQLSKGYLADSNFDKADFTNAIVDRANFEGSTLKGAVFANAVLTSTSFENADLTDTDFTESALGDFDQRKLCKNKTLKGVNPITGANTAISAGCQRE